MGTVRAAAPPLGTGGWWAQPGARAEGLGREEKDGHSHPLKGLRTWGGCSRLPWSVCFLLSHVMVAIDLLPSRETSSFSLTALLGLFSGGIRKEEKSVLRVFAVWSPRHVDQASGTSV